MIFEITQPRKGRIGPVGKSKRKHKAKQTKCLLYTLFMLYSPTHAHHHHHPCPGAMMLHLAIVSNTELQCQVDGMYNIHVGVCLWVNWHGYDRAGLSEHRDGNN